MSEKGTINRIFNSIGYIIKPNENKILETDIYGYFPDLKKGIYKISKSYFYKKDVPVTSNKEYWIFQEFNIE